MKSQNILVAVDGSPHADVALDYAADLANALGATLLVLHVVVPIYEGRARRQLETLARMEHNEQTEYEMLQQSGHSIVATAQQRVRKRGAAPVEPLVEVGDPAATILRLAKARRSKLIVLGRRGRGTLASVILGSVSHKAIQASKLPILIVP